MVRLGLRRLRAAVVCWIAVTALVIGCRSNVSAGQAEDNQQPSTSSSDSSGPAEHTTPGQEEAECRAHGTAPNQDRFWCTFAGARTRIASREGAMPSKLQDVFQHR